MATERGITRAGWGDVFRIVANVFFNPFVSIYDSAMLSRQANDTLHLHRYVIAGLVLGIATGISIFLAVFFLTSALPVNTLALVAVAYGMIVASVILLKSIALSFYKRKVIQEIGDPAGIARIADKINVFRVSLVNFGDKDALKSMAAWNFFFNPVAAFFRYLSAPKNPMNRWAFWGAFIGTLLSIAAFVLLFFPIPFVSSTAIIGFGLENAAGTTALLVSIGYVGISLFSMLGKSIALLIWSNTEAGQALEKQLGTAKISIWKSAVLGSGYNFALLQNSAKTIDLAMAMRDAYQPEQQEDSPESEFSGSLVGTYQDSRISANGHAPASTEDGDLAADHFQAGQNLPADQPQPDEEVEEEPDETDETGQSLSGGIPRSHSG